jgi:DsbC/DsbD-like thiol-disulfide interchange protein
MNQLRACALFLLCVSHLVFGQQPENQVRAQLLSPVEAVVPGSTVWFGLALTIAPGWNTYWSNPGVTGLPPSVTFGEGDNSITPELFFPVAATKAFGGDDTLLTYGYSDQVIHPFAMTVPASTAGSYVLEGEARWLVCRELCIPESQPVRLALPVVTAAQTPALHPDAARIDAARGAVPADFPGGSPADLAQWLSGCDGSRPHA